jgi:hypothetical protein
MEYRLSVAEYAAKYHASRTTIYRWQGRNAPLDDEPRAREWIATHRSRLGTSKHTAQRDKQASAIVSQKQQPLLAVAEAEIIEPITPTSIKDALSVADGESTLARLVVAEKLAYRRYIESGSGLLGMSSQKLLQSLNILPLRYERVTRPRLININRRESNFGSDPLLE